MNEQILEQKTENIAICPDIYLFVCTGNTCRSPMAEALFNRFYAVGDGRAMSAGLFADGTQMSENAVAALAETGIVNFRHTSVTVNEKMLASARQIIGISASHADKLTFMFPQYAGKITALPIDIADPFGGSIECYRKCLADIKKALDIMFGSTEIRNGE